MERALIVQFEDDMQRLFAQVTDSNLEAAKELASLPLSIRGFGPVKHANSAAAEKRCEELWSRINASSGGQVAAE